MKRARVIQLFACAAAGAVACADPASLRVDIDVRESNLAVLRVAAVRDRDGAQILSCTFPSGERADDACLLDGGTKRWDGDLAPLSFWIYGQAKADLRISAAGFRNLEDTVAATSTEAIVSLPDRSGDEATLQLVLVGRTSRHRDCTATISGASNDRSALAIYDLIPDQNGEMEIIASSGGGMSFRHYRRTDENCTFEPPENFMEMMPIDCPLADNSIVAGPADDAGTQMFAGLCNNEDPPRMIGARFPRDLGLIKFTATGSVGSKYSRPTIADLDGRDGPEIYFIEGDYPLELVQWAQGTTQLRHLGALKERNRQGLQPFSMTTPTNGGPLAVFDPILRHDVLIIAGYRFGLAVVTDVAMPLRPTIVSEDGMKVVSLAPVAVAFVDGNTVRVDVIVFYESSMCVTSFSNQDWTHVDRAFCVPGPDGETLVSSPGSREFVPAVGDVDGDGKLSVVTVQKGKAFIYPLDDTPGVKARSFSFWDVETAVQQVLLANIDGVPGAEIIAYNTNPNQLNAVTSRGAVPDGWPIDAPGNGVLRAAIAELDPPDTTIKDLELITLSKENLEVFSLGPGSWDPDATPWPQRDHDAAQRGVIYIY